MNKSTVLSVTDSTNLYPGKSRQVLRAELSAIFQKDGESTLEYFERKKKAAVASGLQLDLDFCESITNGIKSETLKDKLKDQLAVNPDMDATGYEKILTGLAARQGMSQNFHELLSLLYLSGSHW